MCYWLKSDKMESAPNEVAKARKLCVTENRRLWEGLRQKRPARETSEPQTVPSIPWNTNAAHTHFDMAPWAQYF